MYKFKKHRREITKDFPIRGYEKSVVAEGDSALLPSSAGVLRNLKIVGRSQQEQYQGYNLLNEQDALNTNNWIYVGGSYSYPLNLNPGTRYTVSVEVLIKLSEVAVNLCRKNDMSLWAYDTVKRMYTSENGEIVSFVADGRECLWVYGTLSSSNKTITEELFTSCIKVLLIEGEYTKENIPPYEPYVGGRPLPRKDWPQSIVKSESIMITVGDEVSNEKATIYNEYDVLCGFDGFNDTLTLDFAKNTAKLEKQISYVSLASLIPGCCTVTQSSEGYYAEIIRLKGWREGTKAYCTHCKQYDVENYSPNEMCFELINDGYDTKLYLYNIEATTDSELLDYATENGVMLAYVMENQENSSKKCNLPREALPYGVNAVVEASGCEQINAIYYSLNQE